MVAALTKAKLTDLMPLDLPEVLKGADNGLPANYDPGHPCADALPPTAHSHTFWPDGRFNSYDQHGQQVDEESYRLLDANTFRMGDVVAIAFRFTVANDRLSLAPVVPADCSSTDCRTSLAWAFSVAFPGQIWNRVTSGPHVP